MKVEKMLKESSDSIRQNVKAIQSQEEYHDKDLKRSSFLLPITDHSRVMLTWIRMMRDD
jgi:hypothetical protein